MSSINLTARISLNATQLRDRITVLGEQISTGRKGKTYAAVGSDAPKAMDLRAEIGRRETYQATITQTLSKIRVSQDVLDRIGAIAQKFTASSVKLLGAAKPEEIQTQAAQAEAAMVEVATLLNEQLNGEYLFGGSDVHNPPIPNPQTIATQLGGMGREIKNKVASLNGSNVTSVTNATKTLAQSDAAGTTPFSVFLSTGAGATEARVNILGNDNERIAYGIHANRNAAIVSTGETTGSWARDLLRGDTAARPRTILHDHRLAKLRRHGRRAGTRCQVRIPARREGYDQSDGLIGEGRLRAKRLGQYWRCSQGREHRAAR
jgi:flagellin-like hook-associated protein FlgL